MAPTGFKYGKEHRGAIQGSTMDGDETAPDWVHVKIRGTVGVWLKVQIAAHPEWGYDNLPDLFTKTSTREIRALLAGPVPPLPSSPSAAGPTSTRPPPGGPGLDAEPLSPSHSEAGPEAEGSRAVSSPRPERGDTPEPQVPAGVASPPPVAESSTTTDRVGPEAVVEGATTRPPAAAHEGAPVPSPAPSTKKARKAKAAEPPARKNEVEFSLGPEDLKEVKARFVRWKLEHPPELAGALRHSGDVRKLYHVLLREILGSNPKWAPLLEGPQAAADLRIDEILDDHILASKSREYRTSLSATSPSKEVAAS
jgi:hypothetical protein